MNRHHRVRTQPVSGFWTVARPLRYSSWLHRWKAERACKRTIGHCWHPEGFIDWWCCECGGETDGMPPQRCVYCAETAGAAPGAGPTPPPKPQGIAAVRHAIAISAGWLWCHEHQRARYHGILSCRDQHPEPPAEQSAWCFTCERMHEPMEWHDGCIDEVAP